MDTLFGPPSATAFDAVSSLLSAGVYMIVALAALARAPRDPRVRVFLATAIASVAPYCVTAQIWAWGWQVTLSKGMIVLLALSLMMGSLALFHFTQLFPWRRPWIRAHAPKLWAGYLTVAFLVGLAAVLTPGFDLGASGGVGASGGFGAVSPELGLLFALVLLGVFLPVVFVIGLVVPLAGLLSLYKSWQTARARGIGSAQMTTAWMLGSQMGGGVLTILIVPLLHLVAPRGPWVTIASTLLFACAMLMPVAFAIGVWKLDVLGLDIEGLRQ
jgi:hypothetical protein